MDGPSDNIRTVIGVSVGITSGLVILYYFVRLCQIIAMYPKHDEEEVLPAYQPPSFLPATVNCYQEYNNEEHLGRRSSRNSGSRPSTRNLFRDLRGERVPTTTVATTIPTTPSPAYSSWSRNSGYYHNGEMTQVDGPSSLPPGTFVIPMPPAPARPPRSLRRSAGLGILTASLSGQPLLLPAANNNTSTGAGSEPPPPSYSEVVGEFNSQPMSSNRMAGSERIPHPTTIV